MTVSPSHHSTLSGIVRHCLFFTDVDRCLLDHHTSLYETARPALEALRSEHVPVILVSGKTRAEIEPLRHHLNHSDPFIVENGAAVFVPIDTFDFPLERSRIRSAYQVIELGTPYAMLRDVLRQIEEAINTPLKGFGDLSPTDIMGATGLSHEDALRAKHREYDEPFLLEGPPRLVDAVRSQIEARGLRCTKSGRFFHLTGANDSTRAVEILLRSYRRMWEMDDAPEHLETVGIGDSLDDLPLLRTVNRAVLMQKPDGTYDPESNLPGLIRAPGIGAAGWNQAVLDLLKHAA
jgi:mannosyl-3-phosphoglycerate phosphatase